MAWKRALNPSSSGVMPAWTRLTPSIQSTWSNVRVNVASQLASAACTSVANLKAGLPFPPT